MNAKGNVIDKTYLSIDMAEERGFIHRDYVAHCLRWTHIVQWLSKSKRYETARILDVGCGRELPLPKTLYSSRFIPQAYYGVDFGPIEDAAIEVFKTGKFPLTVFERTGFLDLELSDIGNQHPTLITCFEVLEHVEPKHMLLMLKHMREMLHPTGTVFISTPCWDVVSCAANHVNEMKHHALGALLEANGWAIRNVHGTFASIRDYEHLLSPVEHAIFTRLRAYYDVNMLACIFAPLFPEQARNCIWELQPINPATDVYTPRYRPITEVPRPWGSSSNWEDMQLVY